MKTEHRMIEDNYEAVCDRIFDYSVVIKKGYYGVVDRDGTAIIPFDYHYIWPWGMENYLIVRNWGKSGIIDLNNRVVVPIEYDYIMPVNKHLFKVKVGNKYGVINDFGEVVIPIMYDELSNLRYSEGIFSVKLGEAYGLCNGQGKTTGPIFECIDKRPYPGDLYRVQMNGKWIFINSKMEKAEAPAGVIIEDKTECIGACYKEKRSIPSKHDTMEIIDKNGYAVVSLSEKWGLIDAEGNIVVPIVYDRAYVPGTDGAIGFEKKGETCKCFLL